MVGFIASKSCEDFPEISEGYEDGNIYNGDETGVLWKGLPRKTLANEF